MAVKLRENNTEMSVEYRNGMYAADALKEGGFLPEEYVVLVDGKPVPGDMPLTDGTVLELLKVVSGG